MIFKGTIINHNEKSFAIALANYEDLRSEDSRNAYLESCNPFFSNLPIILAAEDGDGNYLYFGDTEIISWLENQQDHPVHWVTYSN